MNSFHWMKNKECFKTEVKVDEKFSLKKKENTEKFVNVLFDHGRNIFDR